MTSLNSEPLSIKAMGRIMWPLGFITYGGPLAHVNVLRAKFCPTYISEEDFNDLFALGQTLPGPTSTQMVIAMGTNLTHSCLGGFIAFLYFSLPASIVLLLLGIFIPKLDSNFMKLILNGFSSAAVAIIGEACYKLNRNALKNVFLIILWVFSAILTYFERTSLMAVILIVIGAISNILYDRNNRQLVPQTEQQEIPKMLFNNPLLGYRSLILYGSLFALFIILQSDLIYFKVASGFFRSGSLVIGGGHVVLPLIQIELKEYITQQQFSDAFALVSCMPGPMFSIAIYLGAMIGGIPLALISQFFMFLPGFFTIFGLLPYWKKYKDIKMIKAALNGIAAVTTGFIASTIATMLKEQTSERVLIPLSISTLIACTSSCYWWRHFEYFINIIMIKLWVFRHGQSIYQSLKILSGLNDYGLTGIGRLDTYKKGFQLQDLNFDLIIVSDLKRTIQTYNILRLSGIDIDPELVVFTPLLREKDQGDFALKSFIDPQIIEELSDMKDRNHKNHGGESFEDVKQRMETFLEILHKKYFLKQQGDHDLYTQMPELNQQIIRILIISHAGFINELILKIKQYLNRANKQESWTTHNSSVFKVTMEKQGDSYSMKYQMNQAQRYKPLL